MRLKIRRSPLALLFALALLLTAGAPAALAQTSPGPAAAPGSLVLVSIHRFNSGRYSAQFDTDGQTVGGLAPKALFDKFFQTTSVAGILNFVTQAGYRVVSFSPVQDHISPGAGGGDLEGYAVLFERTVASTPASGPPR